MIIMGLDPGTSGGISIIENNQNKLPQIIFALKMPVVSLCMEKKLLIQKNYMTP